MMSRKLCAKGWAVLLAVLVVLAMCIPALAGFEEEVATDLSVKTAYLVAPVGEMWLIDIDGKSGVQTGDLFTVVTKGNPIVHPVTQEVIGTLDEVIAVLQVTQVKSGYSYAAVLHASGTLKPGLEVKRYANLPATFWDYTGQGEAVFTELQAALPELQWQSYAAAQAARPETLQARPDMPAGLLFVLTDSGLSVKDTNLQPLRFYRPNELAPVAPAVTVAPSPAAPVAAPVVAPSAPGIVVDKEPTPVAGSKPGSFFSSLEKGAAQTRKGGLIVTPMESKEGIWYGPRLEGKPVGIEVGDLDGDGANEVALAFENRLLVARVVNGEFQPVATHEFGRALKCLGLDGADLNRDGKMELYVTAFQERDPASLMVELQGNQLVELANMIPWMMRRVALPDEGNVLLGYVPNSAAMTDLTDFEGPVFRIERAGNNLQKGAVYPLPENVHLYGFVPYQSPAGHPFVVNINLGEKLELMETSGAVLWESHDDFGGSETYFIRQDTTQDGTRQVYLKQRLEPGPNGTILAPVNEGSRILSSFRQFNASHLRALEYDGYSMVERWRTKQQGGYMADYRMADADNDGVDEIVMIVMFSHGSWFKSNYGESAMLIYEMQ